MMVWMTAAGVLHLVQVIGAAAGQTLPLESRLQCYLALFGFPLNLPPSRTINV